MILALSPSPQAAAAAPSAAPATPVAATPVGRSAAPAGQARGALANSAADAPAAAVFGDTLRRAAVQVGSPQQQMDGMSAVANTALATEAEAAPSSQEPASEEEVANGSASAQAAGSALQPDWPALSPLLSSLLPHGVPAAQAPATAATDRSGAPVPRADLSRGTRDGATAPDTPLASALAMPSSGAGASAGMAPQVDGAPSPVFTAPAAMADAIAGDEGLAPANGLPVMPTPAATPAGMREPTATLSLPAGPQADLRQPLREALGPRLAWQADQRGEQAQLRLSPPQLGHIDIRIRHEAGGLQVQLSASHAEVARQLAQVSDGLRQDLSQRHAGEVRVQVGQGTAEQGHARRGPPVADDTQAPGRALAEADDATVVAPTFFFRDRKG